MSFDGITNNLITQELCEYIVNGKINKIFQPSKNEVLIGIYNAGKNFILNCNISPDNYRINLSTHSKPNPLNAPGFCMLLRKHLIGGKIKKIYTPGFERIVIIELECYNELNDLIVKTLVIELMGKHSNIILLNEKNVIIDSLRHLDSSANSLRDILPAHPYEFPEVTKVDFTNISCFGEFYNITKDLSNLSEISDVFNGFSRLFIQNLITDLEINDNVNMPNLEKIYNSLLNISKGNACFKLYNSDYTVSLINAENKTSDVSGPYLNFFIDDFYTQKEQNSEFYSYRNSILKLVEGTLKKITRKLSNINSKLKECSNKDVFKLYGELLTANMYKFQEFNADFIELENYYDNNNLIKIPVDMHLSPAVNAKNFFKKYNKMKNAIEIVNKQKIETIEDLNYIETIIYELENAKTISDVDEIFSEIKENELFFNKKVNPAKSIKSKPNNKLNKNLDKEYTPIEYKIEGYTFLVGKNNKQNDYLSTKTAKNHDIWFHTKDIHSSHGILQTNNTSPSIDVIIRCAQIIAYYSKARQSSNVPVDYTLAQYVKKPSGSKPGMIIYTHNSTINVQPKN